MPSSALFVRFQLASITGAVSGVQPTSAIREICRERIIAALRSTPSRPAFGSESNMIQLAHHSASSG